MRVFAQSLSRHPAGGVASWRRVAASLQLGWLALAASSPLTAAPAAPADPAAPPGPRLKLHVPSPDWRDQVLYFVLTDRFADGDASNNDQGAGEFRPGSRAHYNGGDLRGLRQRLDYIRGLGVTGLWITPPVANQWMDPAGYTGYHGYWAEHFMEVDRHLGTLADYRLLSDALHRRGMVLVQDIVVNHTGNYFTYRDRWRADDPGRAWRGWEAHDRTPPVPRPRQAPFHLNDPRDPAQRAAGIYHWTPDVVDYTDPVQEATFQMSGLDDLATGHPAVRRALRRSYGFWLREVGVDAFRVDTAFYVPPDFFEDFLFSADPAAPGMERVARATGRRDFFTFGEGFAIGAPYDDAAMRKIERYATGERGQRRMPGMLHFPLYGALGDAFARGRPPAELGHRITRTMQLHARPHLMPTFLDNHDVDRFLAGGSVPALRQALLAMLTLPGIPVIYYGTEQGFTEPRAAMFAAGFGSGGRDRFDTQAPLYRDIAAMTALRTGHRVFTRGTPVVRHANAARAGALAWTMSHEGRTALVVFNTAETESLLPAAETGLPAGTVLRGLYGLDGTPAALTVGEGGRVTLRLPPRSAQVWLAGPAASAPSASAAPTVDPLPGLRVEGDFTLTGRAAPGAAVRVVVDDDLAGAPTVTAGPDGRWQARVDTAAMSDAAVRHTVTAWVEGAPAAPPQVFQVDRPWRVVAEVADPAGDDAGPEGRYRYPTRSSWSQRQMDLRHVQVAVSGGSLRLTLRTAHISRLWNPPNGFDHVNFTVFIELPGQPGGATVLPLQDGSAPEGLRWHRRLRVGGWSDALFTDEGAGAQSEGRPVGPAPAVASDAAAHTVTLTLPAAALGRLPSLAGARLWITTWDYDAGYRPLAAEPEAHTVGGGAPGQPKWMDASAVIVLP